MHLTVLGQSHLDIYSVEHEERQREGSRQRLLAEARAAAKVKRNRTETGRGFIPRLAGALGLF